MLILGATLFWALENILSKYLLRDLPSRIVIWGRMFFGSLFIILFWLMTGQAGLIFSLNLEQIGWVMITSVLLFGYMITWYTGIKYVKVSEAAIVLLLASPITIYLSWIFSNQVLPINHFIGISLALVAGLVLLYVRNKSTAAI